MKTHNFIGILSGVALATLGISGAAQAAILLPTGLNPGDQYRLVFLTSGRRDATSSNIADYNAFVDNAAHASSALNTALTAAGFTPSAIEWTAIASTATTNARVNTATQATDTDRPIYRLDGALVAINYGDLWDGSILSALTVTELGDFSSRDGVWTGTGGRGTSAFVLGSPFVSWGNPFVQVPVDDGYGTWVNWYSFVDPAGVNFGLYGISEVLTVPAPATTTTPEPSSLLGFITLGGLMLGGAVRKARK